MLQSSRSPLLKFQVSLFASKIKQNFQNTLNKISFAKISMKQVYTENLWHKIKKLLTKIYFFAENNLDVIKEHQNVPTFLKE